MVLQPGSAAALDPLYGVTYEGVRSLEDGAEIEVKTRFLPGAEGPVGSYHFAGDGKMGNGSLTWLQEKDGVLYYEWRGVNGIGLLELTVGMDKRSFTGRWTGSRGSEGTWTGRIREQD